MTPRERFRWAAPALVAAAMPLAARLVVGTAAPDAVQAPVGGLVFQMVWAAMPFVALSVLAVSTRRPWAQVRLAMAVGLALTAAVWAWVTWGRVVVATDPAVRGIVGLDVAWMGAPVALLSVMVTAAAVRAAFVPRPPRREGGT